MSDQGNLQTDPPSAFNNYGTLTKLAGAASTFGVGVSNDGTIDFNGFSMTFAPVFAGVPPLTQFGGSSVTDLGGGTMTLSDPGTGGRL